MHYVIVYMLQFGKAEYWCRHRNRHGFVHVIYKMVDPNISFGTLRIGPHAGSHGEAAGLTLVLPSCYGTLHCYTWQHTVLHCICNMIHTDMKTYGHTDIRTCMHTDIQAHRHTDTQKYMQTYKHSDIRTFRHTDTQTHRHTDIQTYRHVDAYTYIHDPYVHVCHISSVHICTCMDTTRLQVP